MVFVLKIMKKLIIFTTRKNKSISNNTVFHRGLNLQNVARLLYLSDFCLGYACSDAEQYSSELVSTSLQLAKRQSASWMGI